MRVSRKSETFKHGEGNAHSRGKCRVVQILENYFKQNTGKKGIFKVCNVIEEHLFKTEIIVGLRNDYTWLHAYDIVATMLYNNGINEIMAIEIDGSTHEKPKQIINDGIAWIIFDLYSKLDQQRKIPDFDDYELRRIRLDDALKAEPEDLIKLIFK